MPALVHELSVAESILELVEQTATQHDAKRVSSFTLKVGELTAIVPEALRFAFEILSKGTRADGARIDIVTVPWRVACSACNRPYDVTGGLPACPSCGAHGGALLSGRELQLMEMNVE